MEDNKEWKEEMCKIDILKIQGILLNNPDVQEVWKKIITREISLWLVNTGGSTQIQDIAENVIQSFINTETE